MQFYNFIADVQVLVIVYLVIYFCKMADVSEIINSGS